MHRINPETRTIKKMEPKPESHETKFVRSTNPYSLFPIPYLSVYWKINTLPLGVVLLRCLFASSQNRAHLRTVHKSHPA